METRRFNVRLNHYVAPDLPALRVDPILIQQVLINLLRNAKQACEATPVGEKRVVVRILAVPGSIRVVVEDNGVGIPKENLTRIFAHGFTTKRDGHGFGLHSGALTARELGGSLEVHSEGLGRGATFTLDLPLNGPGVAA
jgi:signal transduction histidine kinase